MCEFLGNFTKGKQRKRKKSPDECLHFYGQQLHLRIRIRQDRYLIPVPDSKA